MPARVLSAPFIILLILFGCLAFFIDGDYAFWIIPNAVILAVIYSLHPHINWMWYERHPPEMDPRLERYVAHLSPFYRGLDTAGQKKFRDRVELYLLANEFLLRGPKDNIQAPDDLKALFAIPVVELTFAEEGNWRLKKFEHLIFYPTSFPSPQDHDLHACEMETEDGVVIVALDLAKRWVDAPDKAFPIMHYQMAQAYLWSFPDKRVGVDERALEDKLKARYGMGEGKLKEYLGLKTVDWSAIKHIVT